MRTVIFFQLNMIANSKRLSTRITPTRATGTPTIRSGVAFNRPKAHLSPIRSSSSSSTACNSAAANAPDPVITPFAASTKRLMAAARQPDQSGVMNVPVMPAHVLLACLHLGSSGPDPKDTDPANELCRSISNALLSCGIKTADIATLLEAELGAHGQFCGNAKSSRVRTKSLVAAAVCLKHHFAPSLHEILCYVWNAYNYLVLLYLLLLRHWHSCLRQVTHSSISFVRVGCEQQPHFPRACKDSEGCILKGFAIRQVRLCCWDHVAPSSDMSGCPWTRLHYLVHIYIRSPFQ